MFDWSILALDTMQKFTLIAVRLGTMITVAPVFGSPQFPVRAKIVTTLTLSILLFPIVSAIPSQLPASMGQFYFYIITEFIVGIILGFITMITLNCQSANTNHPRGQIKVI